MNKWLRAIELEGKTVKLIPLQKQHREDLLKAATDGELWNLWYTFVPSKDKIDNYIDLVLSEYQNDQALPFVVLDKATNCIIGSTRFCHATSAHRRVEVGYTWYSKTYQRPG